MNRAERRHFLVFSRFDLVANLGAGRARGLKISPAVLLRADRVIE